MRMAVYLFKAVCAIATTFTMLPSGNCHNSCKQLLSATGSDEGNLTISTHPDLFFMHCRRYENEILSRVVISNQVVGKPIQIRNTKQSAPVVLNISYYGALSDVTRLVDSSYRCEQEIWTDCWSSRLTGYSWVTNRLFEKLRYWPGGPSNGSGCACGVTDTCFQRDLKCNCDTNDFVVRSDHGKVTDKADLPLTSLIVGDVSGYWSVMYKIFTLFNLNCYEDVNECLNSSKCHSNANCHNTPGSYRCICKQGFIGDGITSCADVAVCSSLGCHSNASCVITGGKTFCQCKKGFSGNGTNCKDVRYASCNSALAMNSDIAKNYTLLIDNKPVVVHCSLDGSDVKTVIHHFDTGKQYDIRNSKGAGSFSKVINYGFARDTIARIIDAEAKCRQYFELKCFLSRIKHYTWLVNRFDSRLSYWAGGPSNATGCACGIAATCSVSKFKCNCDSHSQSIKADSGFVTNKTDLPIVAVNIGDTGHDSVYNTIAYKKLKIGNIECFSGKDYCITSPCHSNATCTSTDRSFACQCLPGFVGDGIISCANLEVCNRLNCSHNATCRKKLKSEYCECNHGFNGSGVVCNDVDECISPERNDCQQTCNNTIGSYTCGCFAGFSLHNQTHCSDIDECSSGLHTCQQNASCQNTFGLYNCSCIKGYVGNGLNCTENTHSSCKSALTMNNHVSGIYYLRIDTKVIEVLCENKSLEVITTISHQDSGKSVYVSGFERAGSYQKILSYGQDLASIIKIINGSDRCQQAVNLQCKHSLIDRYSWLTNRENQKMPYWAGGPPGGTGCACGITSTCSKVGTKCNCDANDNVLRSDNGFVTRKMDLPITSINTGDTGSAIEYKTFSIGNVECTLVDDCLKSKPCHVKATCKDTLGSHVCNCIEGFTGDGKKECLDPLVCGKLKCPSSSTCANTNGTHFCTCKDGYHGDGYSCLDLDECRLPTLNKCPQACNNTIGSYTCSCYNGYTLKGRTECKDIDECSLGTHNCHANATCQNRVGSFTCSCKKGYLGNGYNCIGNYFDDCSAALKANSAIGRKHYLKVDSQIIEVTCENRNNEIKTAIAHADSGKVITVSGYEAAGSYKKILLYNQDFSSIIKIVDRSDRCQQLVNTLCKGSLIYKYSWLTNRRNQKMQYWAGGPPHGTGCKCGMTYSCAQFGTKCNCDANDGKVKTDNGLVTHKPDLPLYSFNTGDTGSSNEYKKYSVGSVECFKDVDECSVQKPCHANATCQNTIGSFRCTCDSGYTGDGKTDCIDPEECKKINCSLGSTCKNKYGIHFCECINGYEGENGNCTDIDECKLHKCPQACNNTIGSYTCSCYNGYVSTETAECKDIDECSLGTHNCHAHATCQNRVGFFTCSCKKGYLGNGYNCTVNYYDSCQDALAANGNKKGAYYLRAHHYIVEVTCEYKGNEIKISISHGDSGNVIYISGYESKGSYSRTVPYYQDPDGISKVIDASHRCQQAVYLQCFASMLSGFTWLTNRHKKKISYWPGGPQNGTGCACSMTNSCAEAGTVCNCDANDRVLRSDNGMLMHKSDLPITAFHTGDTGASFEHKILGIGSIECFQDVDECSTNTTNKCDQICKNTVGNYECACHDGYELANKTKCVDIDECTLASHNCSANMTCVNTIGSHKCVCLMGYTSSNERSCVDLDECSRESPCHPNATCSNTVGSYTCSCKPGFTGDGLTTCIDLAACNRAGCNSNATCVNLDGRVQCQCNAGFSGDGKRCEDIDECQHYHLHNCSQICVNTSGGYYCDCNPGFRLRNTKTCIDIDECTERTHTCSKNLTCFNRQGSYECDCKLGYTIDKTRCKINRLFEHSESWVISVFHRYSPLVILPFEIAVGYKKFRSLRVCANGYISFGERNCAANPRFSGNFDFVAPFLYMSDAHDGQGKVTFAIHLDTQTDEISKKLLNKTTHFIINQGNNSDFKASVIVAATWSKMKPYPYEYYGNTEMISTFQVVVASDGMLTYVIYIYQDNEMLWNDFWVRPKFGYHFSPGHYILHRQLNTQNQPSTYRFGTVTGNTGKAGMWMWKLADVKVNQAANCFRWYIRQPSQMYMRFIRIVAPSDCPCTINQATLDTRFQLYQSTSSVVCYQGRNLWFFSSQQIQFFTVCCYSRKFRFLINSIDSTLEPSTLKHIAQKYSVDRLRANFELRILSRKEAIEDSRTALKSCCHDSSLCNLYLEKRPVPTCARYRPPSRAWSGGDPHIKTLDGFTYTFNGIGDYVLLSVQNSSEFLVHCRMSKAVITPNATVLTSKATVFSGFAFASYRGPTVEVYLNLTTGNVSILVNKVAYDTEYFRQVRLYNGTEIKWIPVNAHSQLSVIYEIGVGGTVSVFQSHLTVEIASSNSFIDKTRGLLGVNNQNSADDLTTPDSKIIPLNSTQRTIYYEFGKLWNVTRKDSLFTVADADFDSSFVPGFYDNLDDLFGNNTALKEEALRVCGGESKFTCLFDASLTGNRKSAVESKTALEAFDSEDKIINTYPPRIISPSSLVVHYNQTHQFYVQVENATRSNLTHSVVASGTDVDVQPETGFVTWHVKSARFSLTFVAVDSNGNSASVTPKVTLCYCLNGGYCNASKVNRFVQAANSQVTYADCQCQTGYSGAFCQTVTNFCEEDPCFEGVNCTNNYTIGKGVCDDCPKNYTGDGRNCYISKSCLPSNSSCQNNSVCVETPGSFYCKCKSGFTGNGTFCEEIGECSSSKNVCHSNASCINSPRGVSCSCNQGYTGNGTYCRDINECSTQLNNCHAQANCLNTAGAYFCLCKPGFYGNGRQCSDIDECTNGLAKCDRDADCSNTFGSYKCTCKPGILGNGTFCEETCRGIVCKNGGKCRLERGKVKCSCPLGLTGPLCSQHEVVLLGTLVLSSISLNGTTVDTENAKVKSDLSNISSPLSKSLIALIQPELNREFKSADSNVERTEITSFGVGSLIVDFKVKFASALNSSLENLQIAFLGALNGSVMAFPLSSLVIQDFDECKVPEYCDSNAVCENNIGSFSCHCKLAYAGNGFICHKENRSVTILVIVVSVSCLFILIVMSIVGAAYFLRRKRKRLAESYELS